MAFELYPAPSNVKGCMSIPYANGGKALSAPVKLTHCHGEDAIAIESRWSYDLKHLYFEVTVPARIDGSGERSWRYGDGMLLTVSHLLAKNPVPLFTSLGLTGSAKRPQVLVVNSCGRWFPPISCNDVQLRITTGDKLSTYKVAVPWNIIPPVHPLLSDSVGLNLTFIRRSDSERSYYQLCPDQDFDTESTLLRRVSVALLAPASVSRPYTRSIAYRACWTGENPLELALGLITPAAMPIELEIAISQERKLLERYCAAMEVAAGTHRWRLRWAPQRALPTGQYTLEITGRGEGLKAYSQKHELLLVNQQELADLERELSTWENDIQFPHRDATQTILARLKWFCRECRQGPPWETPDITILSNTRQMVDKLRIDSNPLQPVPGLSRRAFRSRLDNELQPYSIYFPRNFSTERKWPALVLLHGGEVDEQQFAATPQLHKLADRLGVILLFPNGRDASGLYLGDCEKNLLEALSVAKKRFPIDWDRIFLSGFSLGGFGTWHTGLRHPELFQGLAVISGIPFMPWQGWSIKSGYRFSPLEHIEVACKMPLLVVHGANDRSVPVEPTREVVDKLLKEGADITFREVPDGGHGNFDWYSDLTNWLRPLLKIE